MGRRKEDDYYEDSSDSSSSVEHEIDRDEEEGSSDEDDDLRISEDEESDYSIRDLPNRKRKLSDEWTVEEKLALRRDHGMTALLPKSSTRSRQEVNEAKKKALKLTKERLEEKSRLIQSGVGDSDKSEDIAKRKKKKSKHAPTEASSKKSDFFARKKHFGGAGLDTEAMGIQHLYKARDPRMSDRITSKSSIYKADRDYAFLQEKVDDEIKELKQRIKAWNATGTKGQRARRKLGINGANMSQGLLEDKEKLQRLTQQRSERMRAQAKRQAHYQWKQDAATRQAEGKPIYYPKRREIKQQLMEAKFDELRKRGGDKAVEKAMAKRRKKNAQKDRRHVPNFGDSRTLVPPSRRN